MIKISHINGDTKVVTLGAYEGIFKPLGYKPVAEKQAKEEKIEEKKEEKTGEEKEVEKPIEQPKVFNNKETKDKRK